MDICTNRACEKERSRARTTVFFLRRDLEAARCAIEELEVEVERLETALVPVLWVQRERPAVSGPLLSNGSNGSSDAPSLRHDQVP